MRKGTLIAIIILATLTVLSLTLNALTIFQLLRARRTALTVISDAQGLLDEVAGETFTYTVEVNQEFPVDVSIPFSEEVTVPINTTIPVNTTVVVPVDLGVTTYQLSVPINTVFPVDMEMTVPVSQTIDVVTTVPVDVEVPVAIPIGETPLVAYLEKLDTTLTRMEDDLKYPLRTD
jgi:hypothetical protein